MKRHINASKESRCPYIAREAVGLADLVRIVSASKGKIELLEAVRRHKTEQRGLEGRRGEGKVKGGQQPAPPSLGGSQPR